MLANLIIGHFMSISTIIPNLGSLCHPHGLEEAPVAHRPDPGKLQRIWLKFELCTATYDPNIPWKYQAARSKQLGGDRLPPDTQTAHRNSPPLGSHAHFLPTHFSHFWYPSFARSAWMKKTLLMEDSLRIRLDLRWLGTFYFVFLRSF